MKIFNSILSSVLFFGILFSVLLSGCSNLVSSSNETTHIKAANVEKNAPEGTTFSTNKNDLPNVELTDEILFKVVSAEIAFQRGDFPTAYATTMAVAEQTHDPRLPKRAMEMALLAKQPLQAFVAARMWRKYAPHSDEAAQYYLNFIILNNNLAEVNAVVAPRLAAATPKERGLILLQTQRLLARSNNKEAAFKVMEELCMPYPDYLETHLALAQAAYANNNSVRALMEAHAALKIKPSSQIAGLTLAQVSPSPTTALKALADFLVQNPTANEVRRAYAGMLVEQKNYVEARKQFELLSTAIPQDPSALYALGVLSLQMNAVETAEKYLKDFVQLLDNSQDNQRDPTAAYLYLSQIADQRQDGSAALEWLKKIQSYNGKNAAYFNTQLRRALLMAKYGNLDEARQFLHNLKTNPEEKIEVIQLDAEILRNTNNDAQAMALLKEATQKYPDNPDLLYDLGMVAAKLNHLEEMENAFRRVIKINPENQQAYNALGYSLVERNTRLPEARALIEKALSLAPNDAFIIDSMGWLEFRENKNEAALVSLQRAYQLRPDADIAVHLGEVLWVMGNQQKARKIWKDAQEKDPNNAALKNTLERLKVAL